MKLRLDRRDRILSLIATTSQRRIASELGVTRGCVQAVLRKAPGTPRAPIHAVYGGVPDEIVAGMRELRRTGAIVATVAERFGVSRGCAHKYTFDCSPEHQPGLPPLQS